VFSFWRKRKYFEGMEEEYKEKQNEKEKYFYS
jgi:ribosomal protein S21